ncbi:MAG: N-acetylmuramoyl-L-alanine amidase [Rhizomicrobium sp.]
MPHRNVQCSSPNHDSRNGAPIDILVLHYTGMKTAQEALARLCDPAAKVSAHYTIDRNGTVYAHVPESERAWHAGVSYWAGERNVNARSIGIEIVNPGHEFGYIPFAGAQIDALIELAHGILARHPIPPARVVGHSDIAPSRKIDPGELFPWQRLANVDVGLWPQAAEAPGDFVANLKRFGYGLAPDIPVDETDVIAAFQRHFRPAKIDGIADGECASLLAGLLG